MPDLPHALKQEIQWLLGVLLGAFVVGFLIGLPLLLPLVTAMGYALWLLWRMQQMVSWLDTGAHPASAPQTQGISNRLLQLIYREKKYSRKQKLRFRSALEQFHSLAAELPDATVVLNPRREIRWANQAALDLLGVSSSRDKGHRIDNLVRSPEFIEFLTRGHEGAEFEMEAPRSKDKTLSMHMFEAGNGMTVLIARDATQRIRLREMRKAFVGDVSHELKNPLTVIRGYLETLLDDGALDPPTRKALQQVNSQADRMRHIVDHLLELSKLDGNLLDENEGDVVVVPPMVQALVSETRESASLHELVVNLDQKLALLGSENELYSAFQNLVMNAVRYTPAGSTISIDWELNALGQPQYRVRDDGPGIEARHLPRLSERFYRVDKARSRDTGGTGLGLAIVKHVAQRHGGQLAVQSTPGFGSEFTITFPTSRAIEQRAAANQ